MSRLSNRVSATIKKSTYENLNKYVAKSDKASKSSVINEALEQYFCIKGGVDEINIISKNIRENLEDTIKPFENRICKLIAKLAKGNFTNLYLLLAMLEELSVTPKAKDNIKQKYEDANKKAYYILKDRRIDIDVLALFPETKEGDEV